MKNNKKQEALELTSYLLCQYWHLNPELFISHLHKNVLWIGSMDSEYIHGAENVKTRIYENRDAMVDVYLKDEEYEIIYSDSISCLIVGRYTAYTKPETGQILSEKQRVTFEWVLENKELKIIHLHLSNILHIQQEKEKFPTIAGKTTYEYVKMILRRQNGFSRICVKDVNGIQIFITEYDIIYIESDGNYINIHCIDKIIRCHMTLKKMMDLLSENFISIGRKFIINSENIIEISNSTIKLLNDNEVQVPVNKLKETVKKIKNVTI